MDLQHLQCGHVQCAVRNTLHMPGKIPAYLSITEVNEKNFHIRRRPIPKFCQKRTCLETNVKTCSRSYSMDPLACRRVILLANNRSR